GHRRTPRRAAQRRATPCPDESFGRGRQGSPVPWRGRQGPRLCADSAGPQWQGSVGPSRCRQWSLAGREVRRKMRLLVVEAAPDLTRQLATALTDAGYVVDRAFDGEEGHYLGETEPYDAVILDIGLPKMDGISVIEAWRRAGRAMPVLM